MRLSECWRLPAAALGLALAAGCGSGPAVGAKVVPPPSPAGYRLALTDATVDAGRHVVVTFTLTHDDLGVTAASVSGLARPAFTLAGMLTDPVANLPTWQSYLLSGALLSSLPLGGPGTPPQYVLANQRQPGFEDVGDGTLAELGGGQFTYTFATALPPGYQPSRTVRVGAFLTGVTPSAGTSATLDFVPDQGALAQRETVLTTSCNGCHGDLAGHGGTRRGVRLCLTCHTTQNADPNTVDPAAMGQGIFVNPSDRTVYAGTGATSFTAAQLSGSATVTWSLSPASGAGTMTSSGATAKYTPPASLTDPLGVTLTASIPGPTAAAGLTYGVTITVLPPPPVSPPTIVLTPVSQTLVAGSAATAVGSTLLGLSGPVAWTLSPATGAGTIAATAPATLTGAAAITYTPPAPGAAATTATIIATAGGTSVAATFAISPGPPGAATRFSDPNPLDLGRLVHRIHRGRNLPTLYLASSLAPAPALPSAIALPLPFLLGRNAVAPGAKFSIVGDQSQEFVPGLIATRTDNNAPAKVLAKGINFPRDLRDCDVCHAGAPQQAEVVNAISRRTCQGCHPDVWYGAGPATDLVHFPHTGGPQADDTACAGCHVSSPGNLKLRVDHALAHTALVKSPKWNGLVINVISVTGMTAGGRPAIVFTVGDGTGGTTLLDKLGAPTPAASASGLPRALTRIRATVSGPASDYQTGNAPLSELMPLTLVPDASLRYTYTFTGALPATARGIWAIGMEARRAPAPAPALYDVAHDQFVWPYTGEAVTEYADNPVRYVDTTVGAWTLGAPEAAPRRTVIERARCNLCHLDINLHGGTRHNPEYCVLCHAPDTTDWPSGNGRPKDASGNVNLGLTFDDLEERSVHFEVMIHRIHTGVGHGRAAITVTAPLVISGAFFDDVRFPGNLADCTLCHPGASYTIEAIPADAQPIRANEHDTILHNGTAAHPAGEPVILPVTASCISCHGTPFAYAHAAQYTVAGIETCTQCHAKGAASVATAHGLTQPTP